MAQRVFRYEVKPPFPMRLRLPPESMWVKFGFAPQSGQISIWAVVVDSQPFQLFDVQIVGTGHDIEEDWNYFDSYIDEGGYVWHLFSKPAE